MSVWTGWQDDLLSDAELPTTPENRAFLTDWSNNTYADCQSNPVDLSQVNPDSHDCKAFRDNSGRHYQSYDKHVAAAGGFAAQIGRNDYVALRAAISSGKPYVTSNGAEIAAQIKAWGSPEFATIYAATAKPPPPPSIKAPQALHGWHAIQQSVNRKMPAALDASQKHRHAALRELRRARKVLG